MPMKLIYFVGRGRAEGLRYILAAAGAEFEDKRCTFEGFAKVKETLPIPKVPALIEENGEILQQSLAIGSYLACKYGLLGDTDFKMGRIIQLAHNIEDQIQAALPFIRTLLGGGDQEDQDVAFDKYVNEAFPKWATFTEKVLINNGNEWLVGNKLSWADLTTAEWCERVAKLRPEVLNGYPQLKALTDKVHKLPNIAKYVERRPETPF